MKILIYSDLHLEFGNEFKPPKDSDADLMVLAGDIITFKDRGFAELENFLKEWKKPVLYIPGNHEYYSAKPIPELHATFKKFICAKLADFHWLRDSGYSKNDVKFFGGTMWTDFNKSDPRGMMIAHHSMNDYNYIYLTEEQQLYPAATVEMHEIFKKNLIEWLEKNEGKKRIVISHHAPCLNPKSNFRTSKLQAAYNSLDMIPIIKKYQPELWIYGHTHEPDDQMIGKTRVISNPFGYYDIQECSEFNPGLVIEL